MYWTATYIHTKNPVKGADPHNWYIVKSPTGGGIEEGIWSITFYVPVAIIQQIAIEHKKSPISLTAVEIRDFILIYYFEEINGIIQEKSWYQT